MRFFGIICGRNDSSNAVRVSSIILLILVICCWVLFSLLSIIFNHVQQQYTTIGHSFYPTQHHHQQHQRHHLNENNSMLYDVNNAMKNVFIQNYTMLFIHVPKAAGTSFTALLRQIQCHVDPKAHSDCCHHPGSCYYKDHRICRSIIGCVSHYPRW
jgi:ABC-type nickel/cobalt efflux system permease component RcnA